MSHPIHLLCVSGLLPWCESHGAHPWNLWPPAGIQLKGLECGVSHHMPSGCQPLFSVLLQRGRSPSFLVPFCTHLTPVLSHTALHLSCCLSHSSWVCRLQLVGQIQPTLAWEPGMGLYTLHHKRTKDCWPLRRTVVGRLEFVYWLQNLNCLLSCSSQDTFVDSCMRLWLF